MWTGGESGLKQDSSSSQHAGDDSGLTGKAEAIDVESTQLDSVAFDSQRDPQLSGDPIEFFSCDSWVQSSDPISSFADADIHKSDLRLSLSMILVVELQFKMMS